MPGVSASRFPPPPLLPAVAAFSDRPGSAAAAAASEPALKPASFLPQWSPQAQFAGYYVAYEQGLYGVTEAENGRSEFYSTERLQAAVERLRTGTPREVLEGVMQEVTAFADGAPQSDDITVMLVRYAGRSDAPAAPHAE
jgi:hypothetical protein